MLTQETKRRINTARDILVGQLPLPSDQIELITIALIYKFMGDIDEQSRELGGKPTFFIGALRDLSWQKLITNTLSAEERVTKFIQGIEAISDPKQTQIPDLFKSIFRNAFLKFRDAQVLKLFLDEINGFSYDHSEELGNAFEYLLDTMGTQGQNGQFRTPRNIIEFIVDVVDPQKEDTILDPACGTAGFLISAYKHIMAANTSPKAAEKDPHAGDLLTGGQRDKLTRQVVGYDITPLMCRLSRVNMYLHHFANPVIQEYDTLTNKNRWGDKFDVILANPPFMTPAGGVRTHDKFRIAANRAEVLFADFILEHLNPNGRAGFIVPEGIIFQNNNDYVSLRKWLINEAGLWAVVSLPAQIFQPYSGVKTSVVLVDRALARQRDDIVLVKVENDGFSLNTNRTPIQANDLPAALQLLTAAKSSAFKSQIPNLKSPLAHRLVPRADFAKLDAYRATSAAWEFCRKYRTRADRLEQAIAEAKAAKDQDEAEKAEKALKKLTGDFPTATGLATLPATEAELKNLFTQTIKEPAAAFGQDPNSTQPLAEDLRKHLDSQREYNLSLDRNQATVAQNTNLEWSKFGAVVLDMRNGVNFAKEQVGEGVPFVNIKDIFTPSGIVNCDALERVRLTEKELRRFRISQGDLVFVRSSVKFEGVGWPAIVNPSNRNIVFCGFVIKCSLDQTLINPYFAMQLFRSGRGRREILSRASRANITNISQDSLADIIIPLPPLDDQRAIAQELEAYQRVVEGCAAVINSYRPSFTPSPDWPSGALGYHFTRVKDLCHPPALKAETVTYIGLENIESQTGRLTGEVQHSPKTIKSAKALFRPGDILFGKLRPALNKVWLSDREGICSTDILVLRPKTRAVNSAFFSCYLRSEDFNARALAGVAGAQLPRVSFDHLAGLDIILPPIEDQEAIVTNIQREEATLSGLAEIRAKFEAKIAVRLSAVWGEPPTVEPPPAPQKTRDSKPHLIPA